jgi:hypothetical protein
MSCGGASLDRDARQRNERRWLAGINEVLPLSTTPWPRATPPFYEPAQKATLEGTPSVPHFVLAVAQHSREPGAVAQTLGYEASAPYAA